MLVQSIDAAGVAQHEWMLLHACGMPRNVPNPFFLTTTLVLRAVGNHLGKAKMVGQQVKASNLFDIMDAEVGSIFIYLAIYRNKNSNTQTNACVHKHSITF